jgi:hypothetical protein
VNIDRFLTLQHDESSQGAFFKVEENGFILIYGSIVKGSSPASFTNYDFLKAVGG